MAAAAYANRRRDDADAEDAALPAPAPDALDGVSAVEPLGIEVGYALVSLVDEKQGGTLLSARALDPPPDCHRDRAGRAAGPRRRQPAARAAHLRRFW